MDEQGMFEKEKPISKVFIAKIGKVDKEAICIMEKIRDEGINAEIEVMGRNLRKQMEYANKKNIPIVVIVGEKDLENNEIVVKA